MRANTHKNCVLALLYIMPVCPLFAPSPKTQIMAAQVTNILSKWHHLINDMQHSTQDFYQSAEEVIKKREMPDIKISRVTYGQGGLFSAKREYLRVSRKEYIFDICAAPFGTGFFVSWWLGETEGGFIRQLLLKIPFIGPLLAKVRTMKTYYQMDTENMFKESVNACVLEAVDTITTKKGKRAPSVEERAYQN